MSRDASQFLAPDFLSLTIGIAVYFVGVLTTQRVQFLRNFSIPEPVSGERAVTEATNLSVGIVDEDGSELSRQIAEGLVRPTFQPAVHITASEIDAKMNKGELLLIVEIPSNFQANVVAQRKTEIQINVDATAVAQAGNGANYLKTAIANEIQNFITQHGGQRTDPVNLIVRAAFNPNLKTAWFSAMTQVINQITLLTHLEHILSPNLSRPS